MKENDETKKVVKEEKAGGKSTDERATVKQAARKKLAEMDLLDDFLFGTMVSYPDIGERFVGMLLKIIFGRKFKHLSVTAQKVFYGADTDLHGARLDVYLEPEIEDNSEENAIVYDVEPDKRDSAADKRALPRRVRFYHAKIAAKGLDAGADYDKLKNVVIVMIMPYDPFGLKHMVYTIKNKCVEIPEMEYEDGACTVFLYTKGTLGVPNEELRQLLRYLDDTTYENAVNEDLQEIHRMVETVKNDSEVMSKHMLVYLRRMEELRRMRKQAKEEAREEVRAEMWEDFKEEVRAEVQAEVREEVRAEGQAAGDLYRLTVQVCRKMKKNQSLEKIAEDLVEEMSVIEPIYHAAKKFVPEYDPEQVFEQINADIEK